MDTNWCTFCGKHIDCQDDALYCNDVCRDHDRCDMPVTTPTSVSASFEYFSMASPRASPVAGSSPVWGCGTQMLLRERSPSLTPMSALDLSPRLPCHAPAYSSSSSRSSVTSLFHPSPILGPSALDLRSIIRAAPSSLPSNHQLSAL
ncbi:hypothetical protein GGI04_004301 [Coemansia thaxteri]|uniref:Uncharacterized protein n=1 Tax=Coemansia thaxteri TaxID=2663907 RepID=A0A9W8EFT4_9FUNG|nr:hypothetical protein GGI04_004301 [Coemansia thaxteri]KAJ2004255.1 hypothetical protein H4R26_002612 [Coemansia thaxteri]KAJ2471253.1 hypothetical protein GGI02_002389 [Coemansia sp. RSA 2322]KAJ2476550.1 hypothetical protein EV174_004893 [Coemansia sp. RSA 2320]